MTVTNLIPDDALTRALLADVLAAMVRHALRSNGSETAAGQVEEPGKSPVATLSPLGDGTQEDDTR